MTQLFINIKELIQVRDLEFLKISGTAMKVLPTLKNAFLLVEAGYPGADRAWCPCRFGTLGTDPSAGLQGSSVGAAGAVDHCAGRGAGASAL